LLGTETGAMQLSASFWRYRELGDLEVGYCGCRRLALKQGSAVAVAEGHRITLPNVQINGLVAARLNLFT
jgi:hypothetical protein